MRRWTVRLTAAAETDFEGIIEWTTKHFGEAQALAYAETLALALETLAEGPSLVDVQRRDEILKGWRSLHVGRGGRKGRHFVMFRVAPRDGAVIEVLRVLHDSMDLPRHLPATDETRRRDAARQRSTRVNLSVSSRSHLRLPS